MKGNIGAMQFEHDLITFLFQAAAKKRVDDCQVDAARLRWLGSRCLIADGVDFHIVAARFQAKVLQCQVGRHPSRAADAGHADALAADIFAVSWLLGLATILNVRPPATPDSTVAPPMVPICTSPVANAAV
jgi:hypothetical protein